MYDLIQSRTFI